MFCVYNNGKESYLNGSVVSAHNLSTRIDCIVFAYLLFNEIEREREKVKSILQHSRYGRSYFHQMYQLIKPITLEFLALII